MNSKIILCGALTLSGGLIVYSAAAPQTIAAPQPATVTQPAAPSPEIDKNLTKQISDIMLECQKIKPGMTRADLLKTFTIQGGLSTVQHRSYVYRGCPYIKVDVEFTLSDPKQSLVQERPTDVISKISNPYLESGVQD